MDPVVLGPNQPPRFYRGGERIRAFRGHGAPGDHVPEDWVASTTTLFGQNEAGLSRLPSGDRLRDVVGAEPLRWLGPQHVERHGADPALLVKLLDAGERLPVHAHPDQEFARRHLDCAHGKTEAWLILEAGPEAVVYLGLRHDVDREQLATWVDKQDVLALTAAMHPVSVRPGDAILVPAGMPHAIGADVFLVELQEPTDFSVLMEWDGFAVDGAAEGHLGLGFDLALSCVDRTSWGPEPRAALRRVAGRAVVERALPPAADPYFRAERLRPQGTLRLVPGFAVLVVVEGTGWLTAHQDSRIDLRRGMTVLVPHGAGSVELSGPVEVIRARPPT